MSDIQISTVGNTLVVDSRLIAEELGIKHKNLLETIKKHLARLERKEAVTFKTRLVERPQGGTYEESYCYLNESQATLLMTFSRNTEKVLDCKERLVDAFMQAKNTSKISIPQSLGEALLAAAHLALAVEKAEAEKALIEQANQKLEEKNELLEIENGCLTEEVDVLAEAVDELFNYSSIIRVAKFNNVSEKLFKWQTLKSASIRLGLEIKRVPDPRFVTKNLYSHDAWRVVYPDFKLPETTTLMIVKN